MKAKGNPVCLFDVGAKGNPVCPRKGHPVCPNTIDHSAKVNRQSQPPSRCQGGHVEEGHEERGGSIPPARVKPMSINGACSTATLMGGARCSNRGNRSAPPPPPYRGGECSGAGIGPGNSGVANRSPEMGEPSPLLLASSALYHGSGDTCAYPGLVYQVRSKQKVPTFFLSAPLHGFFSAASRPIWPPRLTNSPIWRLEASAEHPSALRPCVSRRFSAAIGPTYKSAYIAGGKIAPVSEVS